MNWELRTIATGTHKLRLVYILAALACAASSFVCAVAALPDSDVVTAADHLVLVPDQDEKATGPIKQQSEAEVAFRLHNPMSVPVEVVQVLTSCTCAGADVAAREVQPGASTELRAKLRVGSNRGEVVARVDVIYRTGTLGLLQRLPLTITGSVDVHYDIAPQDVVFEWGKGRETQQATLTLSPKMPPEVRVLEAYSTHPSIEVRRVTQEPATGKTAIHLTFEPAHCIDPALQAFLVIRTDSQMEPIHRVRMSTFGSTP